MAYPAGVVTRAVTIGGATGIESGVPLELSALIQASRGLIRSSTGWRFPAVTHSASATAGGEISVLLPVTDQADWREESTGSLIDVAVAGSYTHTYTVTLTTISATGRQMRTIGPFALPTGDGSPVDLDTLLPTTTVAGGVVLVPDSWDARVVAAEAAAASVDAKVATRLPRSLMPAPSWDVDVAEAVAVVGETQVPIVTPYGAPNAIVHPSLLFFDEGWHGWRYWMAYTPYNNADPQLENPCIAVSNDGLTWSVPAGLTNPIEPSPVGDGYLADPVLCMSADGATMLMLFKINDTTRQVVLKTSVDGVTWTPKQVVLENTYEDVSPALLWDNGRYRLWTIVYDVGVTGGVNTMYVREASAPEGPWSAPVACTATGLPPGSILWHIDIKRVGQQYHAVLATAPDEAGPAETRQRLWFGKSGDGLTWTFAPHPIMVTGGFTQQGFYKAGILPVATPAGLAYDMWYSGTGDYRMYRTRVTFNRTRLRESINAGILAATAGLAPWVIGDSFTRADTTAGLGTAPTGQVWTTAMGNAMGVQSGQAYLPVEANSRSVVNAGIADIRAGVTFRTLGTSAWMLFRYSDATNLWRLGHSSTGVIQMQKIVGGVLTTVTRDGGSFNLLRNGDRLEVEARGSLLIVFLNGLEIYRVTDAALSTATQVGFNVDNTLARLDDFTVRSL